MKTLLIGILIAALGVALYLLWTSPSQQELDSARAQHDRERKSLISQINGLKRDLSHDSLKRIQLNKQSTTVIKSLQRTVNELKISLLIGVPDSTVIDKQDSVIGLQTQIINRQAERIWNDSIYIANIHANFERRLAIQSRETQLLQEEVNMQKQALAGRDEELKREKRKRVKGDIAQYGVIGGLLILIGLTL